MCQVLEVGCDYSVFRQGISPDWEHEDNMEGGRWILSVDKESLDNLWQRLIAVMVGEDMMLVTGVVVSRRKYGDKMAVWMRDAKEAQVNILQDVQCNQSKDYNIGDRYFDANMRKFFKIPAL